MQVPQELPPAAITLLGPLPSFDGGNSKIKTFNGEDCGGVGGVPGLYVPVVGAIGSAAVQSAESGINPNPTYTSGAEIDAGTFADLLDANEPTVVSSGFDTIDEIWTDCRNWHEVIEHLRGIADVVCPDGSELWATCIPPPDTPQRIVFGDGDLELLAGNHMGLFVVTGQIRLSGSASVTGLILAVGEGDYLVKTAGNGRVRGAIVVADIAGPDGIYGNADDCRGPGTGDNRGFDSPTYVENGGGNGGTEFCTVMIAAAWLPPFEPRKLWMGGGLTRRVPF